MKTLIVIPSRYASTRYPGKPLIDIAGKSLVQRTYLQALKVAGDVMVVVATDDSRIYDHVTAFGGKAVMTSSEHPSGTDRCFEAAEVLGQPFDILINLQGDEPFILPEQVESLIRVFHNTHADIATLKKPLHTEVDIWNENIVKVITDKYQRAIYFSRFPIPFKRGIDKAQWHTGKPYYRHIGIYGFRSTVIPDLKQLQPSPLETSESLEQLRWLENGFTISVAETDFQSPAIDSPEDMKSVEDFLKRHPEMI